jgi:predicted dehydrogenase
VTSPNQAHFEQAVRCIEAGKHVLCEKPLAMDSQQSERLVKLAASSSVATGVNYNIRYYPLCQEAAARARDGQLGKLYHVSGSYTQDWLFHETDFNWRVLSSEGGPLRALADIGTHWLDLMQFVANDPITQVCADLLTVFPQRKRPSGTTETFTGKHRSGQKETEEIKIDTEDFGAVLLRFDSGAKGLMHVSQVMAGRKNSCRFELAGAKQALSWDSESPNALWMGNRDSANETLIRDPALMSDRAAGFASYPAGHNEGFPDTFKQLFGDFYSSIADGSFRENPSYPTFSDGHREILLCEAILRSASEQSWQSVLSVEP